MSISEKLRTASRSIYNQSRITAHSSSLETYVFTDADPKMFWLGALKFQGVGEGMFKLTNIGPICRCDFVERS